MTKENINQAVEIVNEYIQEGLEIIPKTKYEEELLSLVNKNILMNLGCKFVTGIKDYMEVPYTYIPEEKVKSIILLNQGTLIN